MSIQPGLVSITFRQLTPEEVVTVAAAAGLKAIEWGGDVHVPHGDLQAAARVAELTASAGLAVAAYGSYYRLGHSDDAAAVVRTAAALGAPTVRVWAGQVGSAAAGDGYWSTVVADARRIAALAADAGMTVSFEYHRNTLTDTRASTARLLDLLPEPAIRTLWQPQPERDRTENLGDLQAVLPRLTNMHVFAWTAALERRPLADGRDDWAVYLAAAEGSARYALLEFVVDDDPARLAADAATLRDLVASA
jgi:sugar phosphate isomerase/epimerase